MTLFDGDSNDSRKMKLRATLRGKTYQFRDLCEVMAKANEEKSGDRLAGVAAADALERVAAKLGFRRIGDSDALGHVVAIYSRPQGG